MMKIAKLLKDIRTYRGFTLVDVHVKTGITTAHLSRVENGKADISLNHLEKLACFYGYEIQLVKRR